MKQQLWIIILMVSVLLGFMMGYSVPPFMEVGFGVKTESAPTQQAETIENLEDYYKSLYQQDDSGGSE